MLSTVLYARNIMVNKVKMHWGHRELIVHSILISNLMVGLELCKQQQQKMKWSTNIKRLNEMFALIPSVRACEKYKENKIVLCFTKLIFYEGPVKFMDNSNICHKVLHVVGRKMNHLLRCFPCKHENLNPISRTHIKRKQKSNCGGLDL